MSVRLDRRDFLRKAGAGATGLVASGCARRWERLHRMANNLRPSLVVVFADQWRAQAAGYAGDPNVETPHIDRVAANSINFVNAVSVCPVCTPYRASLLTGQYPLTTGIFLNDVHLNDEAVSIAKVYKNAGYDTAYIGKWHLNGSPNGECAHRTDFIPESSRQGFDYWMAQECTHDYNHSSYWGDRPGLRYWDGYDAIAQTRQAQRYIENHAGGEPFCLFLSWGPPHDPYHTPPETYRARYDQKTLVLRPNVSESCKAYADKNLRGYYAHIAALDECVGMLDQTLEETGLAENTIFVLTSDHGDMLGSQGRHYKWVPWDESVCVPFLLRFPAAHGKHGRNVEMPISTPDIMPTLLGLSGIEVPPTVEGEDFSGIVCGRDQPEENAALFLLPVPYSIVAERGFELYRQYSEDYEGGPIKGYRGIRTQRYLYVADTDGPWLLYDNAEDPYQQHNLCGDPAYATIQTRLQAVLEQKLRDTNDDFRLPEYYVERWAYEDFIELYGAYRRSAP
jgi:arylsulfatase A-like enzyme